jgi:hypothetical protein
VEEKERFLKWVKLFVSIMTGEEKSPEKEGGLPAMTRIQEVRTPAPIRAMKVNVEAANNANVLMTQK